MKTKVLLALLLAALTTAGAVKLFLYDLAVVHSNDMAPNLLPGDVLLANKGNRTPLPGQLVLFEHPAGPGLLIRRVVAIPGETFALVRETPQIGGQSVSRRLVQPVQPGPDRHRAGASPPLRVVVERLGAASYELLKDPTRRSKDVRAVTLTDSYYVLSDNRNHGADSRDFGPIASGRIRAVVTHRLRAGEPTVTPSPSRPNYTRFPW